MNRRLLLLKIFLFLTLNVSLSQEAIIFGLNQNQGNSVETSDNAMNDGYVTLDGFDSFNTNSLYDVSRFLNQATLGAKYEEITALHQSAQSFESWIDGQFTLPMGDHHDLVMEIFYNTLDPDEVPGQGEVFPHAFYFPAAWFHHNMTSADLLRNRVATALSEIFVVSVFAGTIEDHGNGLGDYYDILYQNSFGNIEDILLGITLHPIMGEWLSHIQNSKAIPEENIHPDENFAREVMQLFTIGLFELEENGQRKKDAFGNDIPTYDNTDIKEFAKVFTGLGYAEAEEFEDERNEPLEPSMRMPMKMFSAKHETGPKRLLNGYVIPAGQSGLEDIRDAIHHLFNHPNTAPFLSKALIQFLTTSNPSPGYIYRVSQAFKDNGNGVRGDMKAIIKAILLDSEARSCDPLSNPTFGKLREPMIRYLQLLRSTNLTIWEDDPQYYFYPGFRFGFFTGQMILKSPSVFNFFQPSYAPNGAIIENGLVAPEFQIHSSSSAIGFINEAEKWTFDEIPISFDSPADELADGQSIEENPDALGYLDIISDWESAATNVNNLVERLNVTLAAGQMSDHTKSVIVTAITPLDDLSQRVHMGLYLTMMAPDYAILK